jgi:Protein of unknown function (DUF3616)
MKTAKAIDQVEFKGDIQHHDNLSAVAIFGDFLLLGTDESHHLQVLKRKGNHYCLVNTIDLNPDAKEIDIEGITCNSNRIYAIGSHSSKRKKLDPEATYEQNRALMLSADAVQVECDRNFLGCFILDDEGQALDLQVTDVRPFLEDNPLLNRFIALPSKENGIDIEGIAYWQDSLYIGFRGPVLRENWVPVLKCRFGQPIDDPELRFVNLGGRGIRDLAPVETGLLILAGPVGDGDGTHHIYFWNSEDTLPGQSDTRTTEAVLTPLAKLPKGSGKAEGIVLLKEKRSSYEVLIVFDGEPLGAPTCFSIEK